MCNSWLIKELSWSAMTATMGHRFTSPVPGNTMTAPRFCSMQVSSMSSSATFILHSLFCLKLPAGLFPANHIIMWSEITCRATTLTCAIVLFSFLKGPMWMLPSYMKLPFTMQPKQRMSTWLSYLWSLGEMCMPGITSTKNPSTIPVMDLLLIFALSSMRVSIL